MFSTLIFVTLITISAARQCTNLTIPLSLTSRNGVFNLQAPTNDIEVTNLILDLARQSHNFTNELLTGYKTISGHYTIAATICHPDSGPSSTVQVLTHGIGFDRRYWDFPFANYNYSYVSEALKAGYSTFAWDRLGTGQSSHGDPVNEIQAWLEISALHALTVHLKKGTLPGAEKIKFPKTINVGHSFGSFQTYALTALYPDVTDGIVLTGWSRNGSFIPFFALGSNFVKAPSSSGYPNGYLAPSSTTGVQIDFFAPGQFNPDVLTEAFSTGQPVTVGELLTISAVSDQINSFKGPVLIITGDRDIPFCGGDCSATGDPAQKSILSSSQKAFPNAKNFETIIVPKAGHGLNLEYSHTFTYNTILDYLSKNGLKA